MPNLGAVKAVMESFSSDFCQYLTIIIVKLECVISTGELCYIPRVASEGK